MSPGRASLHKKPRGSRAPNDRIRNRLQQPAAQVLFRTAECLEEQGKLHEAFLCLRKAAELGDNGSQVNLGNFYASGTGVRKSLKKAAYWYRVAHRGGSTMAATNLAIDLLSLGKTVAAIRWFKKGIERRDGSSYIRLAKIYADRRGGRKRAIELLNRARRLGDTNASELDRQEAVDLLAMLK